MKNNRWVLLSVYTVLIALGLASPFILNRFTHDLLIANFIWYISYTGVLVKVIFFTHAFTPEGNCNDVAQSNRIIAIVPVYNESYEAMAKTVASILDQTVPVSVVYVVDDGSKIPMKPYIHPRVICLRQENKGKRHAQANALSNFKAAETDFILTVDSDSIIEKHAVEKMLRHFNTNNALMGVSALVLASNYKENTITRIADLNIATSCLVARPIRSHFGALETTSGALAMYRKEIMYDNIEDYLTSGTYSDDRQLCYYCALKGDVIALNDICVISSMPTSLQSTLKQRLRWSKGSWKFFPKQMRHLPFSKKVFPIISMIQTLSILVFLAFIIYTLTSKKLTPIIVYVCVRLVVRFAQSLLYIGNDKRMTMSEKIYTMMVIMPLELLFTTLILTYIKYKALFYLNDSNWITR